MKPSPPPRSGYGSVRKGCIGYEGSFVEWSMDGQGTLKVGDDVIEGTFVKGELTGPGVKRWAGKEYKGEFLRGEFNGRGELRTTDETYTGEFLDNKYHGHGERVRGSVTHRGLWRCHRLLEGKEMTPESTYEGSFNDRGQKLKGRITWKNNSTFDGDFHENGLHNGEFRDNGFRYVGAFDDSGKPADCAVSLGLALVTSDRRPGDTLSSLELTAHLRPPEQSEDDVASDDALPPVTASSETGRRIRLDFVRRNHDDGNDDDVGPPVEFYVPISRWIAEEEAEVDAAAPVPAPAPLDDDDGPARDEDRSLVTSYDVLLQEGRAVVTGLALPETMNPGIYDLRARDATDFVSGIVDPLPDAQVSITVTPSTARAGPK